MSLDSWFNLHISKALQFFFQNNTATCSVNCLRRHIHGHWLAKLIRQSESGERSLTRVPFPLLYPALWLVCQLFPSFILHTVDRSDDCWLFNWTGSRAVLLQLHTVTLCMICDNTTGMSCQWLHLSGFISVFEACSPTPWSVFHLTRNKAVNWGKLTRKFHTKLQIPLTKYNWQKPSATKLLHIHQKPSPPL